MSEANDCEIFTCPKCQEQFVLNLNVCIPSDQRVTLAIKSESRWICAETIAEAMRHQTRIFKRIAKRFGTPVEVFVTNMKSEVGLAEIEFTIATMKPPE